MLQAQSNPPLSQAHRVAWTLALLFMLTYGYFFSGGGYNQNARLDLVIAAVHLHTLSIDAYHDNTADKAAYAGHFYSDKAPGLALLGMPVAWVMTTVLGWFGHGADDCTGFALLAYVVTWSIAGGAAVFAALAVYYMVLSQGGTLAAAVYGAMVTAWGSPLWAYATLFWGHALGAGLLAVAVACASAAQTCVGGKRRVAWVGMGACLGWAVLSAYPALLPAGVIVIVFGWQTWQRHGFVALRDMLIYGGLTASIAGVILLAHNAWIFGSPFVLGYSHTQGFSGMKTGFFGIGLPRLSVMYEVLLGPSRGLFRVAPALAAGLAGLGVMTRQPRHRAVAYSCLGCFGGLLLINAGYAYWNGGYCFGPRHLGDVLPLLAVGSGFAFDAARTYRFGRPALIVLLIWGIAIAGMTVATHTPADDVLVPWQDFVAGHVANEPVSVFPAALHCQTRPDAPLLAPAWNLGILIGLRGLASLLPLLVLWSIGAVVLFRLSRTSQP